MTIVQLFSANVIIIINVMEGRKERRGKEGEGKGKEVRKGGKEGRKERREGRKGREGKKEGRKVWCT